MEIFCILYYLFLHIFLFIAGFAYLLPSLVRNLTGLNLNWQLFIQEIVNKLDDTSMTLFVAHRIVWFFSDLVCIKISFIHRLLLLAHLVAKYRAGFWLTSTPLGLDWNEFYSRPASSANITISNAFPVVSKFHAIPRLSQKHDNSEG